MIPPAPSIRWIDPGTLHDDPQACECGHERDDPRGGSHPCLAVAWCDECEDMLCQVCAEELHRHGESKGGIT